MANNVSFCIRFHQINDAAKARWMEMVARCEEENGERWLGDLWVDGSESSPTKNEVRQGVWTLENIGPKWAYCFDMEETGCIGYSAWSAPEDAVDWILEQLSDLDPELITSHRYEDEALLFAGCYIYSGAELVDGREDSEEEIRDEVLDRNPDLKEKWDEEYSEWVDDEEPENWRELIEEFVASFQTEVEENAVKSTKHEQSVQKSNSTSRIVDAIKSPAKKAPTKKAAAKKK